MSLIQYRLKRDFSKTGEPAPKKNEATFRQRFVIQEHQASHLHYDFRMEMEDEKTNGLVLKSWAIPKNVPQTKGIKHLAIQTEDHPVEYLEFEGTIPEGNYGAGEVAVWDKGKWGMMKGSLGENRLSFNLWGEKIKGRYIMIRTGGFGKEKKTDKHWLMWKKEDELV